MEGARQANECSEQLESYRSNSPAKFVEVK